MNGYAYQQQQGCSLSQVTRAIPFVTYSTSDKKFSLGEKALKTLEALRDPIAVAIVCGRARLGKSYILNRLAGIQNGFEVGHEDNPCTKGLWLWPNPIRLKDETGKAYNLILLDSEGIDSCDQEGKYSLELFALSVLISSLLIYNSVRNIDESTLDNLAVSAKLCERIQDKEQSESSQSFLETAPSFLWLLRDAFLRKKGTSSEYLEQQLSYDWSSSKNQIRQAIKSLFADRECFALPVPSSDARVLWDLNNRDDSELEPDFVKGITNLKNLVLKKAQPKKMFGVYITGPELGAMAIRYVKAINSGEVPDIPTVWEAISEASCRKAVLSGCQVYIESFSKNLNDSFMMEKEHQRCVAEALQEFDRLAMGDDLILQSQKKQMVEELQNQFSKSFKLMQLQSKVTSSHQAAEDFRKELAQQAQEWSQKIARLEAELQQRDDKDNFYIKFIQQQQDQIKDLTLMMENKNAQAIELAIRQQQSARESKERLFGQILSAGMQIAGMVLTKGKLPKLS